MPYKEMTAERKAADAVRQHHYRTNNPEYRERENARRRALVRDPEKWVYARLRDIRARAGKRNLEFNITEEDLVLPEVCPVLGIPLILGAPAADHHSPHVDRINSSLGYVKGNVRIISGRANYIKRDASFDEIEALYNFMKANQWPRTSQSEASGQSELSQMYTPTTSLLLH